MRIIALSGSRAALPALNHLFRANFLSAVICSEDTIGTEIAPLQNWAADNEIPCWQVDQDILENDLSELIAEITPDLIIVYGFPYKVPGKLLNRVKHGGWNVHFNLQPEQQGSITIHQLAEGERKQVLHQHCISLLPTEEAGTPIHQLSLLSVALLQASIRNVQVA